MEPLQKVATGIPGLDHVLGGGLPANRMHLVLGTPGTGKTTLALQFLLEGAARGERVLYVTLAETAEELQQVASAHGWDLGQVTIRELAPSEESLRQDQQYTILYPGEVELGETVGAVLQEVEESQPSRIVFDSLSELRLLARDHVRYRHQILALKQFFAGRKCTVLLLDNIDARENSLESVAHGVILLEQVAPEYGRERRRLRVVKLRGAAFRGGYHDVVLATGGLTVYPRLIAAEHRHEVRWERISSGVSELDEMFGGGLDRGTSVLMVGPAGVGKSSLAAQYVLAAAERGEASAVYIFDESREIFLRRAEGLEMDLRKHVDEGTIILEQVDPAQLSPGAFIQGVRDAVENRGARLVVIDSLNGYMNAMAEERFVLIQLHELLTFLGQNGVLTLLTLAQHGMVGGQPESPLDASYLADTVVMIRYFEAAGSVRQAVSVIKRRTGAHDKTIREMKLGPGVQVGAPLVEFEGVLSGTPRFAGPGGSLIQIDDN